MLGNCLTGQFTRPHTKAMADPNDFRKCSRLSAAQSDALFFPPPGGKSNKAAAFCATCPVRKACLLEAISNDLDGFWAGTTKESRRVMLKMIDNITYEEVMKKAKDIEVSVFDDFVGPVALPLTDTNGRRIAKRKAASSYSYLDEIEPSESELEELAEAM